MFGFRKSPANKATESSDNNLKMGKRTSSEPQLTQPNFKLDDDDDWAKPSSKTKNKNKGSYSDSEDFDNMSMQQLEGYAVNKAEETTNSVNNCMKIAENIRDDATRTMDTLYQQGEQIHRTHMIATDIDKDLSKGEKVLGNLGGMFSMPWKPKKSKAISGPKVPKDNNSKEKKDKEQREKLGLAPATKARSGSRTPPSEPMNAIQKVEMEKAKQDDALSDLSGILGDLKGMAVDMGSELNKQSKALDHLNDDVEEINSRVKGANQRTRRLTGK